MADTVKRDPGLTLLRTKHEALLGNSAPRPPPLPVSRDTDRYIFGFFLSFFLSFFVSSCLFCCCFLVLAEDSLKILEHKDSESIGLSSQSIIDGFVGDRYIRIGVHVYLFLFPSFPSFFLSFLTYLFI